MDWQRASPADLHVDAVLLDRLTEALRRGDHGQVDSLLLVRHDRIAFEATFAPDYAALNAARATSSRYFDTTRFPLRDDGLHTMQSVTKSVTALTFGIARDRGDLPGLDTPMLEFFGGHDVAHVDARKRAITLEDLLSMRAGFAWDEASVPYSHPDNDCARMEVSRDWIAVAVDAPMAHDPGSTFCYSSGVSMILSHVFHAATGRTVDDYARQHLFAPLGIGTLHWDLTPTGLPDTEGGLFLRPRDLARLGRLALRGGDWDGRRVVSRAWLDACLRPATRDARSADADWPGRGYGYQWWLLPVSRGDATEWIWTGLGFGGQRLFVVPWLDLVVVMTAWSVYGTPALGTRLFREQVLPAVHPD